MTAPHDVFVMNAGAVEAPQSTSISAIAKATGWTATASDPNGRFAPKFRRQTTMTKTAVDASIAKAPANILPECHPAPWSYREETEGQPTLFHYQEEPDVRTDDARRRHVVRDASGSVVIECVKPSKNDEEKLARAIAAIPGREAEIEKLKSRLFLCEDTMRAAEISNLNLRARNEDLEAAAVKLTAECSRLRLLNASLCEVLPTVAAAIMEGGTATLEAELAARAKAAWQRSGFDYGFACARLRYAIRDAMDNAQIPGGEAFIEAVLWKLHDRSVTWALQAVLDKLHADVVLVKENGNAA